MSDTSEQILLALCESIYEAEKRASDERKREACGDSLLELLVVRKDKVRVEIRKENARHNEPHLHLTHSDKINVSLSLNDFRVLAGKIDKITLKYVRRELHPIKPKLIKIWKELNEKENSIGAEKIISNLFG